MDNYSPRIEALKKKLNPEDKVLLIGFMAHSPEKFEQKIKDKNCVIEFIDGYCDNYLGIDVAPEGYKEIKQEYGFEVKKENFLESDYTSEFDVILSFNLLDHIPQLQTFYKKADGALKDEGRLIVSDDDPRRLRTLYKWLRGKEPFDDDNLMKLTPSVMENHANIFGFEFENHVLIPPNEGFYSPLVFKHLSKKLGSSVFMATLKKAES